MPCAVCERWVEPLSRLLGLRWRGHIIVASAADSGDDLFSHSGFCPRSQYSDLRVWIAQQMRLAAPTMIFYTNDGRSPLGDSMQVGDLDQVVVDVLLDSGWMRWRRCECRPPPDYIRRVTVGPSRTDQHSWYFICDDCQGRNPILRWYGNIDRDGIASEWDSESGDEWDDWDRISWFGG